MNLINSKVECSENGKKVKGLMLLIVSLKEIKNYLRVDFDDDDALIRQLMDTAQKLCMEIVRTDDISILESDKKSYKTAVLYSVAYLYENREKPDYNLMKLTLRALLANYRAEGF